MTIIITSFEFSTNLPFHALHYSTTHVKQFLGNQRIHPLMALWPPIKGFCNKNLRIMSKLLYTRLLYSYYLSTPHLQSISFLHPLRKNTEDFFRQLWQIHCVKSSWKMDGSNRPLRNNWPIAREVEKNAKKSIWWDIKSCRIPTNCNPHLIINNWKMKYNVLLAFERPSTIPSPADIVWQLDTLLNGQPF